MQDERGAAVEEVDGDVGVGEVALGAEDPTVARGDAGPRVGGAA